VQSPHPPLILGGSARPRGAALAARWADEYNTPFASVDEIRERGARLRAACEAVGREPIPLSLMTGVIVGLDREEVHEKAAALAGFRDDGFADVNTLIAETRLVGTVEEVAEQLLAYREAGVHRVMLQHLLHTDLGTVELIGRQLAPLVA